MISALMSRAKIEFEHFHLLTNDMKHMLLSYGFYLAAYPLIATFMNAYLWRSSGNLWSILLYNLGWVIGLPFGFYINGLLLKKFNILRIYFFGLMLQAIIPCLIVFLPFNGLTSILLYGTIYGAGAGLFWGNKNYLDLQLSRGANRMYYNSLGSIIDLLVNIIMPIAAGWFIVYMNSAYSLQSFIAYKIIMVIGFILLFASGFSVQFSKIQDITIHGILLRRPKKIWNYMRMYHTIHNIQVGVTLVLSSILVLVLVGGEGILGTLQTVTAGLSAIALYFIGRKATISIAWRLVMLGSIIFFIGTCVLAGIYTWVGALAYTIVITIAWSFQYVPTNSVSMELMDKLEQNPEKQYAYIFDDELFFNIGRSIGISAIVLLALVFNEATALRWSPLIVGIIQLPLAWFIYRIVQELPTAPTASPTATT